MKDGAVANAPGGLQGVPFDRTGEVFPRQCYQIEHMYVREDAPEAVRNKRRVAFQWGVF